MTISEKIQVHCIAFLGAFLLRAINCTVRWRSEGLFADGRAWKGERPSLVAFWHADQLLMPWVWKDFELTDRKIWVLISQHRDGRIIAAILSWLGLCSVAGSSSKGGGRAGILLTHKLKAGDHVAVTPDGPKGPVNQVKSGVISVAARSGCSIFPMAIGAERKWVFKSWDRMFLPKPFTRAVRIMGEPITVAKDASKEQLEEVRQALESALNALRIAAENYQYD